MSWRFEQIVTLVGCRTPDLEAWIAEEWIRPVRDESGWIFAEADLASILDHHRQQASRDGEHRASEDRSLTQGTHAWARYGTSEVDQ